MFLHAWYADVPDPENFLFKLFHSQSPRNYFGYANPAVDGLLLRARDEAGPAQRVELYRRAEELIVRTTPRYSRLAPTPTSGCSSPTCAVVEVNGLGDPYIPLRKIWLDRPCRG